MLYKTQGSNGAWKGVDLVPTPQPDGSIRWWGGGPTTATAVEFASQAVDQSGNVAVSNNKVENFLGSKLVSEGALNITLTSGSAPVNGWYHGPVTATVAGPAGSTIQFSLDGGAFSAYQAGGVQIGGDGVHHLLATDNLGDFAVVDVLIDTTAPSVSADIDPGSAASATDGAGDTWYDGPVSVVVTGNDGAGRLGHLLDHLQRDRRDDDRRDDDQRLLVTGARPLAARHCEHIRPDQCDREHGVDRLGAGRRGDQ